MTFRRISDPLLIPQIAGMPGVTAKSWLKTPPASRGSSGRNIQKLISGKGDTIAQLELDQDVCEGEAIPAAIQIQVISVTQGSNPGTVQWTIEWGYGGFTFSKVIYAPQKRLILIGDWFRVSACFIPTIAGPNLPDGTAIVSASIAPADDGQTQWATNWNDIPGVTEAFASFTQGDRYNLFQGPCTLWRVNGYCYGTPSGSVTYVQLFDTIANPPTTTVPQGLCGAVAANGTFSLDVSLSGRGFQTGLYIAASSTGGTYTRDAGATLAVDVELLQN